MSHTHPAYEQVRPPFTMAKAISAPVIAHCPRPGCQYKASGRREGQVLNSLAAHLVKIHMESER